MRFLLLAASVSILALNLAGCSCSVSTNCSDMTSGMVGGDCGPTCTTCDTGCSDGCGSMDCGCDGGSKMQRPMLMQRLKSRLSAGQCSDCGVEGDCGCGLGSRLRGLGSRMNAGDSCGCDSCDMGGSTGLGMGMFEVGPDCQTGTCDAGCDSCGDGGVLQAGFGQQIGSRLKGRAGCGVGGCGVGGLMCGSCRGKLGGGSLLSRVKGCGKFGCGFGGRLCSGCGNAPGPIPHREPGAMGPGGAGPVPTYVYPYYTTRAPRDFLMDNPPTIGY